MTGEKVLIAAIRRLTIHDGPGVRDTVFVKGCPLHCVWCHNPECISRHPQLLFHETLCSGCGECVRACPLGAHCIDPEGKHFVNREKCVQCGKCVQACLLDALEICGKEMSADEVFAKVMRDRDFYFPEGGVTISGGEPALYPDFVSELFQKLKQHKIHTALDTCGAVDFEHLKKILPCTDLVLFDLKGMDPERHKRHTGLDNFLIHENLKKISTYGTPVEIRMPIIPGCSDFPEDIRQSARLLSEIPTLTSIRLLPYHALAGEKYAAAGIPDTLPEAETPAPERLAEIAETLSAALSGRIPVVF